MSARREYFDSLAEEWDSRVQHDPEKIKKLLDLGNLAPGEVVLDCGCGTGILIPYILEKIGSQGLLFAVDFSPRMVSVAHRKFPRERYPTVDFLVSDIMELDLALLFDRVICYSSFPHFVDQRGALRKMARMLKDEGRVIVCHSEGREKINERHRSIEAVSSDILPSSEEISRWMDEEGLEVELKIENEEIFFVKARPSKV